MAEKDRRKLARKKRQNRELILKALTDPKFRRELKAAPERVMRKRGTRVNRAEIALVLAAVKGIEAQIRGLADELLCLNGPCGIAAG
jgi:hypothetical protein